VSSHALVEMLASAGAGAIIAAMVATGGVAMGPPPIEPVIRTGTNGSERPDLLTFCTTDGEAARCIVEAS
jgi:hypothetical protein